MTKINNEIIQRVDQYVEELGLNEEILGLKSNDDKVLYYYNYMDNISNRFCELIEFPNLYHLKLANMLCNNDEKFIYYMDTYYNENNIVGSVERFKKYIKEQRTHEKDLVKNIEIAIETENWTTVWYLLQELYIEPFDECFITKVTDMVNNGLDVTDIYDWYKSGKRFLSMLAFDIKYIKSRRGN